VENRKHNTRELYNLPNEVIYCTKCTVSNQRPRISFDQNGICSACKFAELKREGIDWNERKNELLKLCDKYRSKDGNFDVIVPCSGGKDGSFVAHQLKYEFGMNPLTVTWAPLRPTEIGKLNLSNFINSGFNHVLGTPDPLITRKLTKLSFEILGDPFQPFIYGQTNFPLRLAVDMNIPLIMYGENGEVEYGGDMTNANVPTRQVSQHDSHYFSNFPPETWQNYGLNIKDLKPFMGPSQEALAKNPVEIHFLSYYKYWDPQENYYYCREKTGFLPNEERSEGTYSKYASLDDKFDGFHYYLGFIKFGIGRATSDSAHEIRDDKISREEGIQLVKKFDGEFPNKYLEEFLDYCQIDAKTFHAIIDSWRSDHIWNQDNFGNWFLKNPIWKQN